MSLELKVLVVGKNNKDTKKIIKFLEDKKIPYNLHKLGKNEIFNKELPACYTGQFQMYGVKEIKDKIKGFYEMTRLAA